MGRLTTHVLDTTHGCPASGMRIDLFSRSDRDVPISSAMTNRDGRLSPEEFLQHTLCSLKLLDLRL